MANDLAKIAGLNALKNAFDNMSEQVTPIDAYAVGSPIKYGPFLEEGTSRMPPYPWLQPAVDETVRDGKRIAKQASTTNELLRITALDIEANARARLEDTSTRPYPQTGTLAGSVETVPLE
ncbi:hypothetical protein [Natrialba taiwanensis]|uniref:Uncharacterized protein n=1 Tax=Natrialba taiwanensis DSM 12281 TaxID=1230458 RepID=L9ZZH3_9EURY|nr:hypothetical protein [Natrialba taiwanensis]ELY91471.1 hypothetical protein C484_10601 [Natrialba taiwanensis DSM 12281]